MTTNDTTRNVTIQMRRQTMTARSHSALSRRRLVPARLLTAAALALLVFEDIALVAVEGFAWLLGDLESRMADPEPLLRAVRLTEAEPSMLGCSAHVMGIAT